MQESVKTLPSGPDQRPVYPGNDEQGGISILPRKRLISHEASARQPAFLFDQDYAAAASVL